MTGWPDRRSRNGRGHRFAGAPAILAVGLLVVGTATSRAQQLDRSSVAGEWRGDRTLVKDGLCGMAGSAEEFRLVIEVDADGSIRAGIPSPDASGHAELDWRGSIKPNLTLSIDAAVHGSCRGQARDYRLALKGKVTEKNGKLRLELAGNDSSCPVIGCSVKQVYVLEKQ